MYKNYQWMKMNKERIHIRLHNLEVGHYLLNVFFLNEG